MMNQRKTIVTELGKAGLIAVVRARSPQQVMPLAAALLEGGIRAIEITFTTPDAPQAIAAVVKALGDAAVIGAGTVLNLDQCHQALDVGAQFVVSPIMRPSLLEPCHRAGCPVMLGAYSPTEAQLAHEAGSDLIKIFPADGLGPNYIKALKAPLPHLPIVPTGGVNLDTMEAFLRAGCHALGVGSSLINQAILQQSDWSALRERAQAFSQGFQQIAKTL